ncbi:PaaI family thioesterase [Streptomyces bathyalis]|uniref:PaaI family thioesterase n=1 Tax=Streptomyces bathyalis TaxID=2710756 RepID=A0A7T1T882_9ACTN|nr:PaaI family thioesterase [Streptomyces bathyalis]QPP08195.1 PaaI family thioesterase [Streptomyces bathyalis]
MSQSTSQSTARPAGSDTTRSRTHTWAAPTTYLDAGGRPGLELVRLGLEGHLPQAPICGTLGFRLVEAEEGRAVFEGEPGEHLFNPMGTVHGGFLATLLDSALGTAVMTTLPAGRAYTTVQLGVNLVRPVFGDTPTLRCEGTTLHVGRTTATAEARVTGAADGRLYAHGTTTCAVFALPQSG